MYSLSQLKRGLDDPHLLLRELNRLYHQRLGARAYNIDGVDVYGEDWDNLLILDACRYDMFDSQHDLPGTLESRRSRGTHTKEFLRGNFAGKRMYDTVYVTASPMYYRNQDRLDAEFHHTENVWRDGWHDEYRTVLPETLADHALKAAEQFPDKRLIVHFLQPHYPFIGPTGREHFELDDLAFEWDGIVRGTHDFSNEILWKSFRENLDIVLPHVESLLEELPGKTVTTADHGQMIGERATPIPIVEYGHPPGIYTEELVKVPWLVHRNGPRKTIRSEEPTTEETDTGDDAVTERLKNLGYV